MAKQYLCACCAVNPVSAPGELCSVCASMGFGGGNSSNGDPFGSTDPFGNTSFNGDPFGTTTPGGDPFGNTTPGGGTPFGGDPYGTTPAQGDPGGNVPWGNRTEPGPTPWTQQHVPQPSPSTRSAVEVTKHVYRGTIQSLNAFSEGKNVHFLGRWFGSLFSAMPFSMKPVTLTMQISVDARQMAMQNQVNTARHVIAHVDERASSMFSSGNRVVVHGSPNRDGMVCASSVYNETTRTNLRCGISPWVVRLLTLLVVGAILLLGSNMLYEMGGLTSNPYMMQQLEERLSTIIALVLVCAVAFFALRNNPRLRSISIWILLIVLTALIFPSLCVIIIILFGIRIMFGHM